MVKFDEIVLRERERKLSISRVPKEVKERFIKLAEDEFTDDYGLTLKFVLEQALEYQKVKKFIFDNILEKISQTEQMNSNEKEVQHG